MDARQRVQVRGMARVLCSNLGVNGSFSFSRRFEGNSREWRRWRTGAEENGEQNAGAASR